MLKKIVISLALCVSLLGASQIGYAKEYKKEDYLNFIKEYAIVVENDAAEDIANMCYVSEYAPFNTMLQEIKEKCLNPNLQVKTCKVISQGEKLKDGYKFILSIETENGEVSESPIAVTYTDQGMKVDRDYNLGLTSIVKKGKHIPYASPQPRAMVAQYNWYLEPGKFANTNEFISTSKIGVNYRQSAIRGTYMLVRGASALAQQLESKVVEGDKIDKAYQMYFNYVTNDPIRLRIYPSTTLSRYWGEVYN